MYNVHITFYPFYQHTTSSISTATKEKSQNENWPSLFFSLFFKTIFECFASEKKKRYAHSTHKQHSQHNGLMLPSKNVNTFIKLPVRCVMCACDADVLTQASQQLWANEIIFSSIKRFMYLENLAFFLLRLLLFSFRYFPLSLPPSLFCVTHANCSISKINSTQMKKSGRISMCVRWKRIDIWWIHTMLWSRFVTFSVKYLWHFVGKMHVPVKSKAQTTIRFTKCVHWIAKILFNSVGAFWSEIEIARVSLCVCVSVYNAIQIDNGLKNYDIFWIRSDFVCLWSRANKMRVRTYDESNAVVFG